MRHWPARRLLHECQRRAVFWNIDGWAVCRDLGKTRPTQDFLIVEQGAHRGEFATDVLEALREIGRIFSRPPLSDCRTLPDFAETPGGGSPVFADKIEWSPHRRNDAVFVASTFPTSCSTPFPVHLFVAEQGEALA